MKLAIQGAGMRNVDGLGAARVPGSSRLEALRGPSFSFSWRCASFTMDDSQHLGSFDVMRERAAGDGGGDDGGDVTSMTHASHLFAAAVAGRPTSKIAFHGTWPK
jgi:hypothetical protein